MIISYQKWIGLNRIGLMIYQNTVEWLLNTKDNAVLWSYSGHSDTVSALFGNTCTLVQAKQEGDDPPLSHMNSGYSWAPSQDFRGYVFNPNLKSRRSLHVLFWIKVLSQWLELLHHCQPESWRPQTIKWNPVQPGSGISAPAFLQLNWFWG